MKKIYQSLKIIHKPIRQIQIEDSKVVINENVEPITTPTVEVVEETPKKATKKSKQTKVSAEEINELKNE